MSNWKDKIAIWKAYLDKKLIRPMMRQYSNPQYLARSTAVGMGLAFSPIPGQIPVVIALWIIARKLKLRFSLAIAIAWTFISNVFTNLPLFYLYYITGEWIRDAKDAMSYDELKNIFDEGMFNGIKYMLSELGLSIFLGSFLYMLMFGILGYGLGYMISRWNRKEDGSNAVQI